MFFFFFFLGGGALEMGAIGDDVLARVAVGWIQDLVFGVAVWGVLVLNSLKNPITT